MYTESLNNLPSTELMHHFTSTSTDNAVNPDYNINNLDFNIYSQSQPETILDYSEHELFTPLHHIGQQAVVNHQETQINNVTNYSETLNNHLENFHYTTTDQSNLSVASPHGYSENITTPLLVPNTNPFSVQSTPLLSDNQLLFSPIYTSHSPALSDFILDDIVPTPGTPYTSVHPCTPLITPTTPYLNTPYVNNNSPYSVASSTINTPFGFQTATLLDTPIETNADPNLYDESGKSFSSWFSLFPPANVISDPVKTSNYNYSHISQPFEYLNMDTLSLNIDIDKKVDTTESPKSHHSENSNTMPSEKNTSIASPTSATDNIMTATVIESSDRIIDNNSGFIETIKTEITTTTQTPDSAPTTPVGTPNSKLVAIRPRLMDDDDENNESTRRSKRQRALSVDENDDDEENGAEKKYNCPDCGRGFNRKFNMQTHRATHDPNRVKPFACEHPNCGSRFTRKHDLKRHINGIHKGEKVHECTVCRKPFSRKDAWKRHIATCGKV